MRFLSVGALWWFLLSAPIIFFYLLKLKRKRRIVPSVFLWQRALEEIEANAPFRKLRRSLLLLLQLLALAALVISLARPLVTTRALASGNTVIIIDSTASMSARDEDGRSRLERAKQIARDMIDGLGGGDRAAIIEASSRVTVRSPLNSDHAALASAVSEISETDAAGNLADALLLAEQIVKAERDTGIVVIGDGGGATSFNDAGGNAVSTRGAPLRFVGVGSRADNAGIIALNSRPAQAGARQEVFASIANFSNQQRAIGVELRVDGKLVDASTVSVGANERAAVIFDSLPSSGGLAELKLGVDDDLASDNVAYAFLPDARRLRVGVVSDNPFLLQALAVNPDIEAQRVAASAGAPLSEFDVIVSEGSLRPDVLEANRPLFVINPSDVAGLWQVTGQRERPEITSVKRSHPVNSYLSYADLHIEGAAARSVANWIRPIVDSAGGGLVFAGDDGRRRVVMIGFDLAKSDLPLKLEFPILLANSVVWLSGRDAPSTERAVRAGQPVNLQASSTTVQIKKPTGDSIEAAAENGLAVFADTLRAGIYEVKGAAPFAVSLLSESESDTTPRESIKTRAGEATGEKQTFHSEREAWRWAALLALVILAIEWWVYHRRIT